MKFRSGNLKGRAMLDDDGNDRNYLKKDRRA